MIRTFSFFVATVVILGTAGLLEAHEGPAHVHVRDHTVEPIEERIVYLVNDVFVDYALVVEGEDGGANRSCNGEMRVVWTLTPIDLEPVNRYHASLNVERQEEPITLDRTYNLDLFVGSCILNERFTDLAVGTWRVTVTAPTWSAACEIDLVEDEGVVRLRFRDQFPGCGNGMGYQRVSHTLRPIRREHDGR